MTSRLFALSFDANDPLRLARFWAGVLGWDLADGADDGIAPLPSDDTGFRFQFLPTQTQKASPNQMHFHLTSTSLEDQQQTVERALGKNRMHFDLAPPADGDQQAEVDRLVSLEATRVDISHGDVSWVVIADRWRRPRRRQREPRPASCQA